MSIRGSSQGGTAAAAGGTYQDRVAAWLAVRVLAESEADPLWDLPAASIVRTIRAQTGEAMDDFGLDISTPSGRTGFVYGQSKRTLRASDSPKSPLADALAQCVDQFKAKAPGELDRYVIVARDIGRLTAFEPVLKRLRLLPLDDRVDTAAHTAVERELLEKVTAHISRAWVVDGGPGPSDLELRQILDHLWLFELDPEENGQGETDARTLLRLSVLQDPSRAASAWNLLVKTTGLLARLGSGADRHSLERRLWDDDQIATRAPRSNRANTGSLAALTAAARSRLQGAAQIARTGRPIRIRRRAPADLVVEASSHSVVLVGEPGSGKSGALYDFLEDPLASTDVVLLLADRLTAGDEPGLRVELGIDRPLPDVLEDWPGRDPAFLIIDGLDAVRGSPLDGILRRIVEDTIASKSRWRVIVSIRTYDMLRNPVDVGDTTEKPLVFEMPLLTDEEIGQLAGEAPELHTLATSDGLGVAHLLRLPFNLRLAAALVYEAGVPLATMSAVQSQGQLLDLYWRERVLRGDNGSAREIILRRVVDEMVAGRRLMTGRSAIERDVADGRVVDGLLSDGVLANVDKTGQRARRAGKLSFAHNILFDFAAARLLFGDDDRSLTQIVANDSGLGIFLRPSIRMHLHSLWDARGPAGFFTFALAEIPRENVLLGSAVASVAVERVKAWADIEPLYRALESAKSPLRGSAGDLLRRITNAIGASDDPLACLAGDSAGPWLELVGRLSSHLDETFAGSVAYILDLAFPR